MMHHPSQIAKPEWASSFDWDQEKGRETRRSAIERWSKGGYLVIGTTLRLADRGTHRARRERLALRHLTAHAMSEEVVTYPGARRPDRSRRVASHGVGIAVYEWGSPESPPVLLAHGGFDFAGTFDGFAPLLADAAGAWSRGYHRGHGDSDHAALYSWQATCAMRWR